MSVLKRTTILSVLGITAVMVGGAGSAYAGCGSYTPSAGSTETCTGSLTNAVTPAGGPNTTVNFNSATIATTIVDINGGSSDNSFNFNGSTAVTGTEAAISVTNSALNDFNLYDNTSFTSSSTFGTIILNTAEGTVITLNDNASVTNTNSGSSFGIIGIGSSSKQVTLNDNSSSVGNGSNGVGILMAGGGNANIVTLNDNSMAYGGFTGIDFEGDPTAGVLNLNGESTVEGGLIGIYLVDTLGSTINVNGTGSGVAVVGPSGAITMSNNDDTLNVTGIATFNGTVSGGSAGNDTLTLTNSTIGLTNGSFTNFDIVTITGSNTLNGSFDMSSNALNLSGSGNLHVNGNITATDVTAGNGIVFGGNNTITGNLIAANGSTVAPGNSVGTINVIGNATFSSGSTYQVEIDASGADRLNATGNITIQPNATLELVPLATFAGSSATFLHADGNLIGTFDNVVTNGVAADVVYTTNEGQLNFSVLTASPSTVNAQAVSSYNSSTLFSDSVAQNASRNAFSHNDYAWLQGAYRGINRENNGNYDGFQDNIYGLIGGAESSVSENRKFGFSIADLENNTDLNGGIGDTEGNAVFASVYGTYTQNDFFGTLGVTGGYHNYDNTRRVSNSGVVSNAESENDAYEAGALAQVGVRKALDNSGWQIAPTLGVEYIHIFADGYQETSGGAAAIKVDDYDFGTLKPSVNLEVSNQTGLKIGDGNILAMPSINLGMFNENGINDRKISGSFSSGTDFNLDLDNGNNTYVTAGAGVDFAIRDGLTAFVKYQHSGNSDEDRNEAKIGAELEF